MKLTTSLPLAGGLAVGYLLGAAAGRARYQQIKTAATGLVRHPKVQQSLFDLADQAKTNSQRLPGPAAQFADRAATRVQDRLTHPADDVVTNSATSNAVPPTASSATQD